jgi:LCP family protein required for cell wall assembly
MNSDGPEVPPRDRSRRGARRRRPGKLLAYVGVGVVAALLVGLVADVVLLWFRPNRIDVSLPGSAPGGSTVLLVGTDSRADDRGADDDRRYGSEQDNPGERADVVLAMRTDDDGSVRLLEIPRDLLVVGEKGAPVRLTTTLLGGPSGLTESLCRSLGLGVDHVAEVRFPGLRSVVDAAGGVEVTTDRPLRDTYTKFELPAGRHVLDGNDALAYVAARRVEVQLPDGTWVPDGASVGNRSSKGAEVLRNLAERTSVSPAHPVAAQRLAWAASGAVAVDGKLSPTEVPGLLGSFRKLATAPTLRLPVAQSGKVVPIARLQPGAGNVLAEFEGTTKPGPCTAKLPEARRGEG